MSLDSNSQSQITKLFEIVKQEDIKSEEDDRSIDNSSNDKISPMIEIGSKPTQTTEACINMLQRIKKFKMKEEENEKTRGVISQRSDEPERRINSAF